MHIRVVMADWWQKLSTHPRLRYIKLTIALVLLLAVCSVLLPVTSGWSRLAINGLAYVGLYLIYRRAGFTFGDIGLSRKYLSRGLWYGLVVMAAIGLVYLVAYVVDQELFKDPRYRQSLAAAMSAIFIYLPLKTVLIEELAFRGLLPALLGKLFSRTYMIFFSSLAFGLWHVGSSIHVGDYNLSGFASIPGIVFVIAAVAATSLAGFGLMYLRLKSRSLLAPILVHWFINAGGILLAAFSWN